MLEVEVKAKIKDLSYIENCLINHMYAKNKVLIEKDDYFNSKELDLKSEDKALRIRTVIDLNTNEEKIFITYKGPKVDTSTMTRQEVEIPLKSFEDGEILLNGLGYEKVAFVEKRRIEYSLHEVTVCLDTVKDLGDYIEIEVIATENEYDTAMEKINKVLYFLNMSMQDTTRVSYLSLLEQKKNEIDNTVDEIQMIMNKMNKSTFGAFTGLEWEGSIQNAPSNKNI